MPKIFFVKYDAFVTFVCKYKTHKKIILFDDKSWGTFKALDFYSSDF